MVGLIIFNIAIILLGFFLSKLLFSNTINGFMIIGASYGLGLGANSILFSLLSLMGVGVNQFVIAAYLSVTLIILGLFTKRKEQKSFEDNSFSIKNFCKNQNNIVRLLQIFGVILLSVMLYSIFYTTLKTGYNQDDEWSYWGTASKRVFQTESIFLKDRGLDGFERYPLLVPITAGSESILAGSFAENFTKIISPLSLLFLLIFLWGFCKEYGLNVNERLLLSLMFIFSGHILYRASTILYADIPYMYLYSVAVLLFGLYINKINNETRLLFGAGVFLSLTSWAKIDGYVVCFASLAFFVLIALLQKYFNTTKKKIFDFKGLIIMIIIGIFFPAFWYIFSNWQGLAIAGWKEKLFSNTPYAITHLPDILLRMYRITTGLYSFSLIWVWVVVFFIIGLFICLKNVEYILFSGIVILNVCYHLATYLFVFGRVDSMIAASFERYSLHFLPIGLGIIVVVYSEVKRRINIEENKCLRDC